MQSARSHYGYEVAGFATQVALRDLLCTMVVLIYITAWFTCATFFYPLLLA